MVCTRSYLRDHHDEKDCTKKRDRHCIKMSSQLKFLILPVVRIMLGTGPSGQPFDQSPTLQNRQKGRTLHPLTS